MQLEWSTDKKYRDQQIGIGWEKVGSKKGLLQIVGKPPKILQ
jgi:hypothetical protein